MFMKIKPFPQSNKERCRRIFYNFLIPLILLLYPLCKSALGVDYMDSMYSPGNFVFFQEMEGTWVIATYLANVAGFLLTCLPGAGTYLGLRIYTNLVISALALLSYFWLRKKIPAWAAALGEVIAIGFCWCPATILYNYLTYLFMLLSLICLYEGLVREKTKLLVSAGIFLGANLFVRFPNVVETGFILAVWGYGCLKKKKPLTVVRETLWCMLGYFISVGVLLGIILLSYGFHAYGDMISSLFSMTDTAASYQPMEMVLAIVREYVKGLKWPAGMALYGLVMAGAFRIAGSRFLWIKRGITVLGILVLFRWYYAKGMFNINYNTYPSIFQWAACFLIVTVCVWVAVLFHSGVAPERKLMCGMLLLVIFITPIGSNNNIFPIINNLFLVAPVSVYNLYHIVKKMQKCPCGFPIQATLTAMVLAVLVQSIGFGTVFSFRGAREGEKRDTKIEKNGILKGMITNAEKAEAIEELTLYWENRQTETADTESADRERLLLFGHIPGVSYFLDTPCAIPHSWPDLASYACSTFEQDMKGLKGRIQNQEENTPVVIVSYGVHAVLTDDAKAMEWYENHMESGEEPLELMLQSEKLACLKEYLQEFAYRKTFENKRFVVYEQEPEAVERRLEHED